MDANSHVWQSPEVAKLFLDDVRGGIPMAAEEINILLRLVDQAVPEVKRLLDIGCGDGILGRAVMAKHKDAKGVFVDFSPHMLETAQEKAEPSRSTFVVGDLHDPAWHQGVGEPFDLVVSGLAIHHLPDDEKQRVYREIFELLKPGGLFLHLERVSFNSAWSKAAYDELFVDSLYAYFQRRGGEGCGKSREAVADEWRNRSDKAHDLPAPVDLQCRWLEAIGFVEVDCFFKVFQLALFGGRKPD
jgi:tRNA (cmo5U34)-methyltransferase